MVLTNFTRTDLRGALLSPAALQRAKLIDAHVDPEALESPEPKQPTLAASDAT